MTALAPLRGLVAAVMTESVNLRRSPEGDEGADEEGAGDQGPVEQARDLVVVVVDEAALVVHAHQDGVERHEEDGRVGHEEEALHVDHLRHAQGGAHRNVVVDGDEEEARAARGARKRIEAQELALAALLAAHPQDREQHQHDHH